MKKIVIDARGYSTSTGRYVRKLIEYLEQLEISGESSYQILLFEKEFNDYKPKNKNFSKKIADFAHYGLAEQAGFLKFLNKLQADLVHFSMPQQPAFYKGRHVTTMHDLILLKMFPGNKNRLLFTVKQQIGKYVFKKLGKTSSFVITPTEFTRQDYLNFSGVDPRKVVLTYESADKIEVKPVKYTDLENKKYIMYVGQHSAHKNLRRLMTAHQQLLKTMPDLQLVLVGGINNYGELNKAWAEENNYKNIVFTGFAPDAQLAWLYQHCAAYVFPSLMEGFGLPPLEAMHYDAPVISSNATCMPEVLGDAAIYFNPLDEDEMASQIKKVLLDPALQKKLIANGKKQLRKYSWKRMAEQTLDIYKKALES
jgi:glycosyltransferase involved in cell wall biosynthesis